LQRVLLATLQRRNVQVFITTHSTHITSGVRLASHIILTCSGGPISTVAKPTSIPALNTTDVSDLERYLDATRSALLYARKVLLVEGPAEQFLVPQLVKSVMRIDLDEEGIAIVPIFGTHFAAYAKLFGPGGIRKKCAILTDGDLLPFDADATTAPEDDERNPAPTRQELDSLRGDFVEIFACQTTFEHELVLPGTLAMIEAGTREIGAPRLANALRSLHDQAIAGQAIDLAEAKNRVLRTAKRFGKARYAQLLSKYAGSASTLPEYVRNAVEWLTRDAPNG